MKNLNDKINQLAKTLGKKPIQAPSKSYQQIREEYERQANEEVKKLQQQARKERIKQLHGQSDLNPKWTFDNMEVDSQDVFEASQIAKSFIVAHNDEEWRKKGCHLMLFYGDYGRGKSHMAGAIAHELIEKHEVSVLYRQLSNLLELRFFAYDFNAQDNIAERFRHSLGEIMDVDLLILDEVGVNESTLRKNAQSWLGSLLRQRYSLKKNCIIITNHDISSLESSLGSYCFEAIREYDTYKVHFSGPSRRRVLVDDVAPTNSPSGYVPNQVR